MNPRRSPVQYLKGIGPKRSDALAKAGISTIEDLFFHVPRRYLDRSSLITIAQLREVADKFRFARPGEDDDTSIPPIRQDATVVGEVRSFRVVGTGPKARFVLILADKTGSMQCVWFGGIYYWRKAFHVGETLAASGQPTFFGNVLQFIHPAFDRLSTVGEEPGAAADEQWTRALNTGGLIPLYPSSEELTRAGFDSAGFRRVIHTALRLHLEDIIDPLPASLQHDRRLVPLKEALKAVHTPQSHDEIRDGLRRLKYEELFLFQLKLALKRHWRRDETAGIAFRAKSTLARRLVDALPFALTKAQVRVIKEISADMESARPMNRLLQGDVGSGKTIVALLAMLVAVENGYQAILMAPTEILAEQHAARLAALLRDLPVQLRLIVGAQRGRLRRDILDDVQRGSAQIIVGTHALFEKQVEFAKLGLVVIDEQHRFGVLQRASIRKKGDNPDVLVMTATPIPRTLSMTLYGDLDVSVIDEMPKDRKPVRTILKAESEKESVYAFVHDHVAHGGQVYFVYPLIEESEKLDLKAATVYFDHLKDEVFPGLRLGLMHGRLRSEEKDIVMGRLQRGELDILVATTVIEVGIDIPNASLMVIENAERFGLSQLHQLRGRVGRGSAQSSCILLAKDWIVHRAARIGDPLARDRSIRDRLIGQEEGQSALRLATMVSTTDGFRIAEMDLELRGPGDFFGTRQSGVPEFRVADIAADVTLLGEARADAFTVVEGDPQLSSPDHRLLGEHLRATFSDELALLRVG